MKAARRKAASAKRRSKKRAVWLLGAVALLTILAVYAWGALWYSDQDMASSVAAVEQRGCSVLTADGRAVVFFRELNADTTFRAPTASAEPQLTVAQRFAGCWANRFPGFPSCNGRFVAAIDAPKIATLVSQTDLRTAVEKTATKMKRERKGLARRMAELAYYMRVHGVQDEGYADVAEYASALRKRLEDADRAIARLNAVKADAVLKLNGYYIYKVLTNGRSYPMTLLATDEQTGTALLQTADKRTPEGATGISMLPWSAPSSGERLIATLPGMLFGNATGTENDAALVPFFMQNDSITRAARQLAPAGSPVFTSAGMFVGINGKNGFISRKKIAKTLWKR